MTADSSKGFFLSTLLHGSVVALMFLVAYVTKQPNVMPVFEIVQGEGDNFGAKVAPALGSETGVKMNVPAPPTPEPPKPEPARVEPEPVAPAPAPPPKVEPKAPTPAVKEPPPPNFAKQITKTVTSATKKAKQEIKKQQEAEAKRAAEEAKKLTKEEFDRQHKSKAPTQVAKNTTPGKAPKVDVEGIKKGVVGGSTENKIGGAGGKVLKTDNEDVLGAYFAMFKERLRLKFEPPPGLSDTLKVEIEIVSHADGTISGAQIAKSSGSKEFDDAVLAALRRVQMPPRPDKKTEKGVRFTFTMRDRDDR